MSIEHFEIIKPVKDMEREDVSEGSGGSIGSAPMDLQKLGDGTQDSISVGTGGTPKKASKYTERERAIRQEASRRWKAKNSDHVKKVNRERKRLVRSVDGGDRQRKIHAVWREKNREHLRKTYREYHAANIEKRKLQSKRHRESWSLEKRQQEVASKKAYRIANRDKLKITMENWVEKNKAHVIASRKQYLPRRLYLNRLRRAADPIQRLKDASRTRVGSILRKAGIPKFNHTFDLIGCTPDFLKAHIERQFKPGMTWSNYGDWEIDHIRPLAAYDLSDKIQLYAAFHYSNCQPLWKIENRIKNCKVL